MGWLLVAWLLGVRYLWGGSFGRGSLVGGVQGWFPKVCFLGVVSWGRLLDGQLLGGGSSRCVSLNGGFLVCGSLFCGFLGRGGSCPMDYSGIVLGCLYEYYDAF